MRGGVVLPGGVPAEPWCNGHGITRVLRRGEGWRVSIAEITRNAPFSTFAGVDRILAPMGDEGLRLVVDGMSRTVAPGGHLVFAGESEVRAEDVRRPGHVLNVMVDRTAVRCAYRAVTPGALPLAPADAELILVVLSGSARLGSQSLPPGSLVVDRPLFDRLQTGSARTALLSLTRAAG